MTLGHADVFTKVFPAPWPSEQLLSFAFPRGCLGRLQGYRPLVVFSRWLSSTGGEVANGPMRRYSDH